LNDPDATAMIAPRARGATTFAQQVISDALSCSTIRYRFERQVLPLHAMSRECVENTQLAPPTYPIRRQATTQAPSAHTTVTGIRYTRLGLSPAACVLLGGCGLSGAPSFSLFGAFFPAWLLCSVFGIVCAMLARAVFIGTGLADILPFQLLVCTSIGLMCGALTWLWAFGY
jgi:hypothetical protein